MWTFVRAAVVRLVFCRRARLAGSSCPFHSSWIQSNESDPIWPPVRVGLHRLSVGLQPFRSGQSQIFLFRFVGLFVPVVAAASPSGSDADPARRPVDVAAVARNLREVSQGTGMMPFRTTRSPGSRPRTSERMCEPWFRTVAHDGIRSLGLSITRGRFLCRSSGVRPMKASRAASFHASVEKPSMASGRQLRSWTA